MNTDYIVYFTGADLVPIGNVIDSWTALDIALRLNSVDTMAVTVPTSPSWTDLAQPGNRLEVLRDDGTGWTYLTGGPIERPGDQDWSADGQNADPGTMVIYAGDDRAALAGRLTYPTPANDSEHQTVTARRTFTTTNAKTIMRTLVNENAGPGALLNRRVPGLALGSSAAAGTTITYSSRFGLLTDDLRAVAAAGGGLIYRIDRSTGVLLFEVEAPTDRSGLIRYSKAIGNLRAYSFRHQAPTFTVAIVGGDGTGTGRTIVEVENTAALAAGWPRIESFVSNESNDVTELTNAGLDALAQAAEQGSISVTAIDNADQRFGRDYGLGDVVTVEIDGAGALVAPVTAVNIAVRTDGQDQGETISPQIGGDPITDSSTLRKLRDLERRLGRKERG
jgi:hypothetical protein